MKKKENPSVCGKCGANLPHHVKFCPNCGTKVKVALFRRWWFWTILAASLILMALFAVVIFMTIDKKPKTGSTSEPSFAIAISEQTVPTFVEKGSTEATEETIPAEYEYALRKAESCSEVMNMSKAGIYNELITGHGETFSGEAAHYAMDNLKVDWNANALACAKDYSETFHMSKTRIYKQLKADGEYGEGFTAEEAQYAVDKASIDWNANAMFKALRYQKEWGLSAEQIYIMLVSAEEFTEDEAQFAVDRLR